MQPEKAKFPILVTELGIVIEARQKQLRNALFPILVTEFGIMTEERLEQLRNASFPILITLYTSLSTVINSGIDMFPVYALSPFVTSAVFTFVTTLKNIPPTSTSYADADIEKMTLRMSAAIRKENLLFITYIPDTDFSHKVGCWLIVNSLQSLSLTMPWRSSIVSRCP